MAAIMATSSNKAAAQRVDTLPFGADKWGHDVIAKVIKGSETSIFVGLAAAFKNEPVPPAGSRILRSAKSGTNDKTSEINCSARSVGV